MMERQNGLPTPPFEDVEEELGLDLMSFMSEMSTPEYKPEEE